MNMYVTNLKYVDLTCTDTLNFMTTLEKSTTVAQYT
jgi:hypothetical protein